MKKTGKFIILGIFIIAVSQFLLVGCFDEDTTDYAAQEKAMLEKFLLDYDITEDPTASGLYFLPSDTGSGPFAELGDSLSIYYAGFYLTGQLNATNIESIAIEHNMEQFFTYDPFVFVLGDPNKVFPGIEEGLTYMQAGGKATMIIPSEIATPDIYTTWLYFIELLEVIKPSAK